MATAPPGLLPEKIEAVYRMEGDDRYTGKHGFGSMPGEDEDARTRKARSWIFLEAFERYFGRQASIETLRGAIQFVQDRDPDAQYLSPADYELKFKTKYGGEPAVSLPVLDKSASPRDRFVWLLRYAMPGRYWWSRGRSATFAKWLMEGAEGGFASSATLNCWEMVFFAAIKAPFLSPDQLKPAYAPNVKDSEVLQRTFGDRMTKYNATDRGRLPVLGPGDIIVSDLGGDFHHVFAILDSAKDIKDMQAIQLYNQALGAGVTFYWDMFDFPAFIEQANKPTFYLLRL